MAEEIPDLNVVPLILPRPVTGHRRLVQVDHPMCGQGNLLTTGSTWSDGQQPNYIVYALTPPQGPKQRTLHTEGPNEITWNISGELTNNTMGLLKLMDSNARGVQFNSIYVYQGVNDSYLFTNTTDGTNQAYFLPWSNFTLNGSQNGAVTFTLEGKSTQLPISPASPPLTNLPFPDVQIPSWYTGNDFVTAWSLAHSVNLSPVWVNTPWPFPAYYRPGHSEFTIQVTMKAALREHSWIKFGAGGVSILEAVVTSKNITFGGKGEPVTYQVTTTNAKVTSQDAYSPSIDIQVPGGPAAAALF